MSANTIEDTLLEWLREAHAMAQHGETMLDGRAKRLDAHPALQARLDAHVGETREHRGLLEAAIARFDADTSTVKDIGGKLSALGHSWGTAMAGEEVVQTHAASLAFEHFEIANYRALKVFAEAAGAADIARTCERILRGDRAMAQWLEERVEQTAKAYVGAIQAS